MASTAVIDGIAGCASTAPAARVASKTRRRPDGIAVDPPTATPLLGARASTKEAFAVLREPLGTDRALATLDAFFRAIVREDSERMSMLFTPDASVLAGSSASRVSNAPLLWWDDRFRRLDYSRLAGEPIYRPSEVEIVRGDDPDAVARGADARSGAGSSRPNSAGAGSSEPLEEDEVMLRVRVRTPRIGDVRLLGDSIVLWLRRDGDRYRIQRMQEDFPRP